MEQKSIFTGVFLVDPVINAEGNPTFILSKHHVTYHYQPGECFFPDDVAENDWIKIVHKGIYDDGEILASVVNLYTNPHHTFHSQYTRRDEDGNDLPNFPLHVTWSSGDLPPVAAGERLMDSKLYNKYFTKHDMINGNWDGYNFKKDTMEANNMDMNSQTERNLYYGKLQHLFSYFHPIGIWKTFRIPPEIEN